MNKKEIIGSVEKSVKENGDEIFSIIASTDAIDRQGDSVDQKGWELEHFMKNPVILWAHDYKSLPIGKAVSAVVVKGKLVVDFMFATEEMNPVAQQVKKLYEEGYLNASSVGFIAKERKGTSITRSELLELSLVPVPANQEALRLATAKGLETGFVEEAIAKGMVASEMDERSVWERKYEKWEGVSDIISAFGSVYFDENTDVESFELLLTESANLMLSLANGDTESDEKGLVAKSISKETTEKFNAQMQSKAGKVLSEKNMTLLSEAITSMKSAITPIEELLNSTKDTEEAKEVIVEDSADAAKAGSVEGDEIITLTAKEAMELVQMTLRASAKANEGVLGMVNGFIAKKNI